MLTHLIMGGFYYEPLTIRADVENTILKATNILRGTAQSYNLIRTKEDYVEARKWMIKAIRHLTVQLNYQMSLFAQPIIRAYESYVIDPATDDGEMIDLLKSFGQSRIDTEKVCPLVLWLINNEYAMGSSGAIVVLMKAVQTLTHPHFARVPELEGISI